MGLKLDIPHYYYYHCPPGSTSKIPVPEPDPTWRTPRHQIPWPDLAHLHEAGMLADEEFQAQKTDLLGRI